MILNTETKHKFGYDENTTKKFSKNVIVVKCDICDCVFEKESIKIFMSRKNSNSSIDVCNNIVCINKKREHTMLNKYGVKNAGLSEEIRNKVKQTCLKKYGVEEALLNKDIKKKADNECFKKYGVDNVFSSEWCKEKIKHTNFKKYGVEYSSQNKEIRNKIENSFLKKYGVTYPSSNPIISKKISDSWVKKTYNKLETEYIKPLFSIHEFFGFNKGINYKFQCKECLNVFENNYIGVQCYKCNPLPRSDIENELKIYIQSIYTGIIKFSCRKEFDNKFEVDILIPEKNFAIELNGNFYHSELMGGKDKNYHLNKTSSCNKLGIKLIHIFEDEWINKQEIVKCKIKHMLGLNTENRIYARNCEIKNISFDDNSKFLNLHHIQGVDKSSIRLGMFYKNKLVSVMTFGGLRKSMGHRKKENVYELIRFASSKNVIGGASKLLSHFIKTYTPFKIISYADRRWSVGNLYEKIGFKKTSNGKPNYWYVNKKNYLRRYHRFNFRKDQLNKKLQNFDVNLTEWGNMQLNGYDRIWDCGSLKYEFNII